jgi:hypothetical protein
MQYASYTNGDYNDYNYNYADISYDQDRYSYTNYGDEEVDYDPVHSNDPAGDTPQAVDYSDESFPDKVDESESSLEPNQYNSLNDYESQNDFEASGAQETPEIEQETYGQEQADPIYLAPKPKKKIFTNKDKPEGDSVEPERTEDEDDENQ